MGGSGGGGERDVYEDGDLTAAFRLDCSARQILILDGGLGRQRT